MDRGTQHGEPHEEFLELCAASVAGELKPDEEAKLASHLQVCSECRKARSEYEIAALKGIAALAEEKQPHHDEDNDDSWSVEAAEQALFDRLDKEASAPGDHSGKDKKPDGSRFTYRPSHNGWREIWMTLAAAILLALALGITAYRTGLRRGTEVSRSSVQPTKAPEAGLEAQVSDAAYEREQLRAKLEQDSKVIEQLKLQLSEQMRVVQSLRNGSVPQSTTSAGNQSTNSGLKATEQQLSAAEEKLNALQRSVDEITAQRDANAKQAAIFEARVNELSQSLRERDQSLGQKDAEIARGQELLEHDRDVRDLMGARDLYMADIHDVNGKGTEKTYGRVFYTRGKRLIVYAFDLDGYPGIQNASSFQAWGRRGPDKQQARSLGIFYEDNVSKKRWVLKANDPKALEDIDAVFVTVEPNGGSQHPSGKQLLFAYLRVSPNHP